VQANLGHVFAFWRSARLKATKDELRRVIVYMKRLFVRLMAFDLLQMLSNLYTQADEHADDQLLGRPGHANRDVMCFRIFSSSRCMQQGR
jgi:hypothetical protein